MTGDPLLRFARVERLARARRQEVMDKADGPGQTDNVDYDYTSIVLATAEACGVNELLSFKPPSHDDNESWDKYAKFRAQAQRVSDRLLIAQLHARSDDFYSVAFDASTKVKLRHHLDKMRSIVDESDETP
jgi:hypothetical protein